MRALKSGPNIPPGCFLYESGVGTNLVIEERRARLKSRLQVDHRRPQFVLDFHQVTSIHSGIEIFGQNHCYRVSYITRATYSQWQAFRLSKSRHRNGIKGGHAIHQFRALKSHYNPWL